MITWEQARQRLKELQSKAPTPLIIELKYFDDTTERLSVEELIKRDNMNWKSFKIIQGNDIADVGAVLDWIAPFSVIGKE